MKSKDIAQIRALLFLFVFVSFISKVSASSFTAFVWGDNSYGQTNPPATATNAVSGAAGQSFDMVLLANGTVLAWGNNSSGQTNVPNDLTNAVAVSAGPDFGLALTSSGLVRGWGNNGLGQAPPVGISNLMAVAGGGNFSLGLKNDGTVAAWGYNGYGQLNVPTGLSNVTMIAAGGYSSLALKSNGSVAGWGQFSPPMGLTNIVSITAGQAHGVGLKSDGTVIAWGDNTYGQLNVPVGLSNVVAVSAFNNGTLALREDGTVLGWGITVPANLTNVISVFAGGGASMALINTGSPLISRQPGDQTIGAGTTAMFNVTAVGPGPLSYQWKFNDTEITNATNSIFYLPVADPTNAGVYSVVVSNLFGGINSSNASLTVVTNPIIIEQPSDQMIYFGSNANFSISVIGGVPLTYQWRWNGTNITDATNALLDLTNVQLSAAGTYSVLVSNSFGFLASSNASLIPVPRLVVGWGANTDDTGAYAGEISPPPGLTNVASMSAGGFHSLALNFAGPVMAWGDNTRNQSTVPSDLSNVVSVAAGYYHSLALKSDSTVAAWGSNVSGETNVPPGLSNVIAIAAGGCDCLPNGNHSLALRSDGTVVSWGVGTVPAGLNNVTAIAAGGNHSLALKVDGSIVGWGLNGNGQATAPGGLSNVMAISAGGSHSMALRQNGTVVAWGNNFYGQTNVPLGLSNVVAISAGENFSAALRNDGIVIAWGSNIAGETVVPDGLSNVVALATGARHCLAYLNDGSPYFVTHPAGRSLYSGSSTTLSASLVGVQPISLQWQLNGTNILGATNATLLLTNLQLTDGGTYTLVASNAVSTTRFNSPLSVNVSVPVFLTQPTNYFSVFGKTAVFSATVVGSVPLNYQWKFNAQNIENATNSVLSLSNVTFLNAGNYSLMVTNSVGPAASSVVTLTLSPVVAWGAGISNTVVDPNYGQSVIPTSITNAISIAAGGYHSLALLPDGRVKAWGYNNLGQTNVSSTVTNIMAIAGGGYHSLALRSNGTVVAWGNSANGILSIPLAATNVGAIAAGWYHNLALRSNGTVIAWGAGTTLAASPNFGQSIVPANLSNVSAIAGGAYHSLALRSNGTVVAWGLNSSGQTNVPLDLTNVVAIAAGASNSFALKNDGTIVAWGNNSSGQISQASGLSNVVAIASGMAHTLALKSDDTIISWGLNTNGQTNIPLGLTNVTKISGGFYHSLVLAGDGAPQAIGHSLDRTAYANSSLLLNSGAVGAPPLSYQWQLNGTNIAGATNGTMLLANVSLQAGGLYSCIVSNGFGVITNISATLNVLRSTPIFNSVSPSITNGGFAFVLDNLSGHGVVIIYASTNFADWQPIFTNPPVLGSLPFADPAATNVPAQFYRAVEQ